MFRPVKTKKVYEEIIEQIKKLIIDGKLQPGDKLLSERELSDTLNVSRASVREAFSALEIMGVISIRPGEGSFVRQISYDGMFEPLSFFLQVEFDDLMKLLEVRKILEVEIAALAATRATPLHIAAMQDALNKMVEDVNGGGIADEADTNFHFAIVNAADNQILSKLMNTISDLMINTFKISRQKMFLAQHMADVLYDSHYEIYEAIVKKNPQMARKKMRDHIVIVEESMKRIMHGGISSLKSFHDFPENHKIRKDFGFPS